MCQYLASLFNVNSLSIPGKYSLVGCLLLALSLRFVFMWDASFLPDEVALMAAAMKLNASSEWATHGLLGTRGMVYGPLATWIFQIYFYIGDLINADIVFYFYLNCFIKSALLFVGLLWIKKIMKWIPPIMIILVPLSPHFFMYSRMLWDNPFLVEMSLLLFCSCWSFIQTPKLWKLALAAFLAISSVMVHFMAVPFVVSLLILLLWERKNWFLSNKVPTFIVVGSALAYCYPYASFLTEYISKSSGGGMGEPNFKFLEGVLLGFSILGHIAYNYFSGSTGLVVAQLIGYVCALYGIVLGGLFLRELYRMVIMGRSAGPEEKLVLKFLRIFWLILIPFAYFTKLGGHPHYFNGIWVSFFLLCSLGVAHISSVRFQLFFQRASIFLGFLGLINFLTYYHVNNGSRGIHYGPTLSNQSQISRQLANAELKVKDLEISETHLLKMKQSLTFLESFYSNANRGTFSIPLPANDMRKYSPVLYGKDDGGGLNGRMNLQHKESVE